MLLEITSQNKNDKFCIIPPYQSFEEETLTLEQYLFNKSCSKHIEIKSLLFFF